jgi:hypothetical protein
VSEDDPEDTGNAGDTGATISSSSSPRRKVVIRRDGKDFVIAQDGDGFVIFRSADLTALRKACKFLRWEVVSDVAVDPTEPATWTF